MKKNKGYLLLTAMFALTLANCGSKTDNRIHFNVSSEETVTPILIDNVQLKKLLEDDKETIALYVYVTGCLDCEGFTNLLSAYIAETHLPVYKINKTDIDKMNSKYSDTLKLKKYNALNFSIWKEGELSKSFNTVINPKFFTEAKVLKSELNKYITLPRLLYISLARLDEKIAADEKFIIYFSRNDCPDCSYVDSAFLNSYFLKNEKVFFALEINTIGIRLNENGDVDDSVYTPFKDKYGLSTVNNPLGYRGGHVPTFQYYEEGNIKAMAVYLNDQYTNRFSEAIANEDGTYTHTITESYYSELIGTTFTDDNTSLAYRERFKAFHNDKLQSFFKTYHPKCN